MPSEQSQLARPRCDARMCPPLQQEKSRSFRDERSYRELDRRRRAASSAVLVGLGSSSLKSSMLAVTGAAAGAGRACRAGWRCRVCAGVAGGGSSAAGPWRDQDRDRPIRRPLPSWLASSWPLPWRWQMKDWGFSFWRLQQLSEAAHTRRLGSGRRMSDACSTLTLQPALQLQISASPQRVSNLSSLSSPQSTKHQTSPEQSHLFIQASYPGILQPTTLPSP